MIDTLNEALKKYPEFLTSIHMVELGLFKSSDLAYLARRKKNSPDFISLGKKILYPKACVIKWISEKMQSGSRPNE